MINLIYGRRRKLESAVDRQGVEAGKKSDERQNTNSTHGILPHQRDIPFMRHALVFNVISLLTFVLAVFFLATRGLHCRSSSPAAR
jgi:hypothetical protein